MSDFGMPYMDIYSAAKSFDLAFSRALGRELAAQGKNVEVLGIMTGAVTDVGWDRTPKSLFRPESRQFARAALGKVGCGKHVVAAWWTHGISWWGMGLLPSWAFDRALVMGVASAKKAMETAKTT